MSPRDEDPGDWLNPQPAATEDDPGMSYELESHSDLELGKLLARYERGLADGESGDQYEYFESEIQRITEYLQPRWDERIDRVEDALEGVLTESSEIVLRNQGGQGRFLVDPKVWAKEGDLDGQYLLYASVWVPDPQTPMTPEYIDNRAELSVDEYAAHFNNVDVFLGAYDAHDGRVLDRAELDHDTFHRQYGYDVPDEPGLESEMSPLDVLLGGIGQAGLKLGGKALFESTVKGAISMGGHDVGKAALGQIVAKLVQLPPEAFEFAHTYETDPALLADATDDGSTAGERAAPDDELTSFLETETEPVDEEALMSTPTEDDADVDVTYADDGQFDMKADAAATAADLEDEAGTFDMAADIAANVASTHDDEEQWHPQDGNDEAPGTPADDGLFDIEADAAGTVFDLAADAASGMFDMAADIAAGEASMSSYQDGEAEICYPDDSSDGAPGTP